LILRLDATNFHVKLSSRGCKVGLAGLVFVPLSTALLLGIPDALLVLVVVALVRGLIVRGQPA
jgi:hypothetical protein